MDFKKILALSTILIVVNACQPNVKDETTVKAESLNVLFIGNSYTFYNTGPENPGLPLRIKEMAMKNGKLFQYETSVRGGKNFKWHVNHQTAIDKIRQGGWDYVVLQDHSKGTLDSLVYFKQYGTQLAEEAKAVGAKPVFYMTWGRENRPQMIDTVSARYFKLAKANNALIAPCGLAFKKALEEMDSVKLYTPDMSHPSPTGVYLNAAVFYSLLFKESPVDIDYTLNFKDVTVSGEEAEKLRTIAWETVQKFNH